MLLETFECSDSYATCREGLPKENYKGHGGNCSQSPALPGK
jgi:hypothetical protein